MNILCVDDEPLVLQQIMLICKESNCFSSINGFNNTDEALAFLEKSTVDILFLDINMPGTDGLTFAQKIKADYPHIALVFVTSYSEYALNAFQLHADGYLTKPLSVETVKNEVAHIEHQKYRFHSGSNIVIQTFGNFEIYVKGTPVKFERKKSKEILAYLVDKRGTGVTRAELASIMWENELYDHSKQKQLDVFIQSLKRTLSTYDILSIFEIDKGELRVNPASFQCDFYDYLNGDAKAAQSYCDNYMNSYSWAEATNAYIALNLSKKNL